LHSDWFHRADVFTSLFERCFERWGTLPDFILSENAARTIESGANPSHDQEVLIRS
jgi:hypothetical protein